MKITELKRIMFLQCGLGKFFSTGMVSSIPIPLKTTEGVLLYNCFWCFYDRGLNVFSGPVNRVCFNADKKEIVSFVSCNDDSFSVGADKMVFANRTKMERLGCYPKFDELYDFASRLFYKENCTNDEKQLLFEFYTAFTNYEDESLVVFYKELTPSFFEWLECELKNYRR